MAERRILFSLAVTYDTPTRKLELIPELLQEIIEDQKLTRFERAHFQRFGDSALQFEIVYWVLSPDYGTYMDIQQAINLAIIRAFDREGIAFAEPMKTVLVLESEERLGAMSTGQPPRLRPSASRQ
jgi:small-conductance mechanosensitive channel